jgi:hypothetical protein
MFDRIVLAPSRTQTQFVTREVREHRAPTDESVKLLREMEQKAKDQVIEAVHVGDTTFECVVHKSRLPMDDAIEVMAIFSLNGKKLTVTHRENTWRTTEEAMMVALRDKMAAEIATAVLLPALKNFR